MKVTQSCLTLWDPMYHTVLGIQARILEWVAVLQPRDGTQASHIAGGVFIG